MGWVFASVVLILAVLHRPFRKVTFWISGSLAVLVCIGLLIGEIQSHTRAQERKAAQSATERAFDPDAYLHKPPVTEEAAFGPYADLHEP